MKIITNLIFQGECREAFEFYATAFGGESKAMVAFGDVPGEEKLGAEYQSQVMHAWLDIKDQSIMGGDAPSPGERKAGGFTVAIHTPDEIEARRIFEALRDGATISMDYQPTPWSPGFGMLTDRFGTPWVMNATRQHERAS